MSRFIGRHSHSMDNKGRLSIPAPFRELLDRLGERKLVITNSKLCLEVFLASDWQKLLRKVEKLPQFKEEVELFKLYYISAASEVALDKQGRILVPQMLREEVGLDREVVIIGCGDRIQIWSKEVWRQRNQEAKSRFDQIRNTLASDL